MASEAKLKASGNGDLYLDIEDLQIPPEKAKLIDSYSIEQIGNTGLIVRFYDAEGNALDLSQKE